MSGLIKVACECSMRPLTGAVLFRRKMGEKSRIRVKFIWSPKFSNYNKDNNNNKNNIIKIIIMIKEIIIIIN